MKTTTFLLALVSIIFSGISQTTEFICAYEDETDPDPIGVFSGSDDPEVLVNTDPIVVNLFFWRVENPNGTVDPLALTEEQALKGIQNLNIIYNEFGIYFKYRGTGSFASPDDLTEEIYDVDLQQCVDVLDPNDDPVIDQDGFEIMSRCQLIEFAQFVNANGYAQPDAINVYVPKGFWDFGGGALGRVTTLVTPGGLENAVAPHEIGHNLGLAHTHAGWFSPNPNYTNCEHVTRNPNDPEYNADIRGDRIIDTPASPDFRREYCYINGVPQSQCSGGGPHHYEYYDIDNCIYQGAQFFRTDCIGGFYQIAADESKNLMSYAPGSCLLDISIGQAIRMKENLVTNAQLLAVSTTSLESLYEPYKGEYYYAGGQPPSAGPPLFQPGFNYRFVECDCDCPQPSLYEDTSFTYSGNSLLLVPKDETNFSSIIHVNHSAVDIDFVFEIDDNYGQSVRRCYDNMNWAPDSGSVTLFNDGVFNTNVTITQKDSLQINDPLLVPNLPGGLYKIEKHYADGSSEETVIVKPNN